MSTERKFMGWGRPALHATVEYLFATFCHDGQWDLSHLLVVVPGARAGRRLVELLALRAEQADGAGRVPLLSPPQIMTPGRLPEQLYGPSLPLASDLESVLARAAVLRAAPADLLNSLFPAPPEADDLPGWLRLADEVAKLDQELAGEAVSYGTVQSYCIERGLAASHQRWCVLRQLREAYRLSLRDAGLLCKLEAREEALAAGPNGEALTIVLVATSDLPLITRQLLAASGCATTALIHAPDSVADGFDEFGSLHAPFWQDREVPLNEEDVRIVNGAQDEAGVITGCLAAAPGLSPEQITVGVGDETLGPGIQRALGLGGYPSHRAVSGTLGDSPPAQLLAALVAYVSAPRASNFAALLRHPDLTGWLEASPDSKAGIPGAHGLPELCDDYRNRHLPARVFADGGHLPPGLAHAAAATNNLFANTAGERPLPQWAEPIGRLLAVVYNPLLENGTAGTPASRGLEAFGEMLEKLGELNEGLPFVPACGFAEAIGLVLARFGAQPLPEESGEAAIDIVGWLEVHLDDAPVLFVAGFNEGLIPESVGAAAFLPDRLCWELGLLDNTRRYARDAYLLYAITQSRSGVTLISARHSTQNEPLAPSRLYFACPPEKVARRALAFYQTDDQSAPAVPALPHGETYNLAHLPRPRRLARPLDTLPVTAFKDYLACPYRFYLKHVLKLAPAGDGGIEMGGDIFGDLAHGVLQEFSAAVIESGGYAPRDAETIEAMLDQALERRAALRFGTNALPVVQLQLHQLHRRLHAFARWQASEENAGWKTVHVEAKVEREVTVDGVSFIIHGRMDRIDLHPASGQYRILDYKTSDSGANPNQTHLDGDGWKDLQLPLYRRLAGALSIDIVNVTVGYVVLPRETSGAGLMMAEWTEEQLAEADRCADDVLRNVRDGLFWPPNETLPSFDDGLASICLDAALDRSALILNPGAPSVHWPDSRHAFVTDVHSSEVADGH